VGVIFIFIDGVGLGEQNHSNPFYEHNYPSFNLLTGGSGPFRESPPVHKSDHLFKGIDANLDVPGLPQSGTGQTALFTGHNAAKIIGKHFGPFPHSQIKPLLEQESIFKELMKKGKKVSFANAYPPVFFEKARQRNRWSCTTLMTKHAGIKLNTVDDLEKGQALAADITQKAWREKLGIDVPEISPGDAAHRILELSTRYDLVLFEFYLTDKAGHSQSPEKAQQVLQLLDSFLKQLLEVKDKKDVLLITSDHGNLEDLSVKTHTRNRVPLLVHGKSAGAFSGVQSLTNIKQAILNFLV